MIDSLLGPTQPFLDKIFRNLDQAGIDVSAWFCDHICYRVESLAEYEAKKAELLNWGRLLTEAKVNGRPIATFRLHKPLLYRDRIIPLVELPAPKPGRNYRSGLEHVEFVVGEHPRFLQNRYPDLPWKLSGQDQELNPELALSFADCAVKFHPLPLDKVIELEGNLL